MGLGNFEDSYIPQIIKISDKIKDIQCGNQHSIALNGKYFIKH